MSPITDHSRVEPLAHLADPGPTLATAHVTASGCSPAVNSILLSGMLFITLLGSYCLKQQFSLIEQSVSIWLFHISKCSLFQTLTLLSAAETIAYCVKNFFLLDHVQCDTFIYWQWAAGWSLDDAPSCL